MDGFVETAQGIFAAKVEQYPSGEFGFCFGEVNTRTLLYIPGGKQWPVHLYNDEIACRVAMFEFGKALREKFGSP